MPDHVYQSAGGSIGGTEAASQSPAGGGSGQPSAPEGDKPGKVNAAGIAGVVGGAGAAAGGAAKIIKDKNENE
jgi:hypothetical protein